MERDDKGYVYLPMPASKELVRKYNNAGYRVLGERFAPAGYEPPSLEEPKRKRTRGE